MSNGLPRRQVLKAVAASTLIAPAAGCLETWEMDDSSSAGSEPTESVPHESGCALGESIIRAFSDGDYETAASYTANRFFMADDVDDPEAIVAKDLESTDLPEQPAWVDGSIADLSCACAESYPPAARDELEEDIARDVTEILELRYSVTADEVDNGDAESVFVDAIEVDGEWYGDLSFLGSRGLCGQQDEPTTDSDSAGDEETASEQSLEPADWEGVEEIVLEGGTAGWTGLEPTPIEGIENPTLLLFEGREYRIAWRNSDGMAHNLQLLDEEGDVLTETEYVDEAGESAALTIEATSQLTEYVCEPHLNSMIDEIKLVD